MLGESYDECISMAQRTYPPDATANSQAVSVSDGRLLRTGNDMLCHFSHAASLGPLSEPICVRVAEGVSFVHLPSSSPRGDGYLSLLTGAVGGAGDARIPGEGADKAWCDGSIASMHPLQDWVPCCTCICAQLRARLHDSVGKPSEVLPVCG